ncbi:nuclear receptor 2C2-associated protein [Fopius arisanus]|uniref:Nuclear receptor 2C2-associated protein n=1 Tax=Fopius arisanus TaxID=64838 RepID=A0A9R1TXB2_9HYME|nr:PREDICTED: nuclear receptor 2C2-associated protein [Fopius arisanus]
MMLVSYLNPTCRQPKMSCILKENAFDCRVSSVLNKEVKSYGKQFMFDDSDETCWNSDSGIPQWILINLKSECELSRVEIQFQGGFAGKTCRLEAKCDEKTLRHIQHFYPEDTNTIQTFKLDRPIRASGFKIIFEESTDFFGRIIIYKLSLHS